MTIFKNLTDEEVKKLAESFYTILTIPNEVEKYIELIEKVPDAERFDEIKFFW